MNITPRFAAAAGGRKLDDSNSVRNIDLLSGASEVRKKFKIFYSNDNQDPEKAGKQYKTSGKDMLVMNAEGIFFVFNGEQYYPSIMKLSSRIGNYDVVWE